VSDIQEATVAHYEVVVLSNPVEGREDEYNRWYDEQHLKDVLAVDGIISAQRYKTAGPTPNPFAYMAVYGVETDDLSAMLGDIGARAGTDRMPMSPAFDGANASMHVYAEHGPRLER
jgi:hypothetical protein